MLQLMCLLPALFQSGIDQTIIDQKIMRNLGHGTVVTLGTVRQNFLRHSAFIGKVESRIPATPSTLGYTTVVVEEVLRNPTGQLKKGQRFRFDLDVELYSQQESKTVERFQFWGAVNDSQEGLWYAPFSVTAELPETFQILLKAPNPAKECILHLLRKLSVADVEQSKEVLKLLGGIDPNFHIEHKSDFEPTAIRTLIANEQLSGPEKGTCGFLLSLYGKQDDADFISPLLFRDPSAAIDTPWLSVAYLRLKGENGLKEIESKLLNRKTGHPISFQTAYSVYQSVCILMQTDSLKILERPRFLETLSLLAAVPEVSDLAIARLHQERAWEFQTEVFKAFNGSESTHATKRAVVRFLYDSKLDNSETNPHATEAGKLLEQLKKSHPNVVESTLKYLR